MSDDFSALVHFSGTARLFPLPNLVLFPQVMQPLHIFEPRYRQMTADALESDRLIALVLLQPGWEADYAGQPAVHPVACLGRIVAEQRLEDGRFNILLRGLSRMHIVEEVATTKLYRSVRAELLHDANVPRPEVERQLRRKLNRRIPSWFAGHEAALKQFRRLLKTKHPLSTLSDILSFALPLDVAVKQELLEMLNVDRRARHLLRHLEADQPPTGAAPAPEADEEPTPFPTKRRFPPEFSEN